MKKLYALFLLTAILGITFTSVHAQCNWVTEISDSYEYNTVVPGLIPGQTVHNTPQSFAVHTGNSSLYMNFVNCNNGMGACVGDSIYKRVIPVCPFQKYRFSTWLTTTFGGTQCNVRIKISDNLGNVLDDQLSIAGPYFPIWVQYQSPEVITLSDTLYFTIYTNVGGAQNGNDLSMDDFLMEKCLAPYTSLNNTLVCGNGPTIDLFTSVPFQNSISGTWSGPSTLTGGHLGTFNPTSNTSGIYIYTNEPFGASCPTAFDSVDVLLTAGPMPSIGPDTTICSTQSILINAGTSGPGFTYLWNNGVTGPIVNASAPGGNPTSITYTVTVTDSLGCSETDSITIDFILCTGIKENYEINSLNIFPQPASELLTFKFDKPNSISVFISIYNSIGEKTEEVMFKNGQQQISIPVANLSSGIYFFTIHDNESILKKGKFVISQ